MSSIGSTDLGYYQSALSNYQNALKEVSEEKDQESSKLKDSQSEEIKRIRNKHDEQLSQVREEAAQEVREAKDRTQAALESQRRSHQAEIDGIKSNYDRYGKLQGTHSRAAEQEVKRLEDARAITQEEADKRVELERKNAENRISSLEDEAQKKLEENARIQKESTSRLLDERSSSSNEDYMGLKAKLEKTYQDMIDEVNSARTQEQKFLKQTISENEAQTAFEKRRAMAQAERDIEAQQQSSFEKIRTANEGAARSFNEQGRDLRRQIGDLLAVQKDYVKGQNQGRQDVIREFENDWRAREKGMVSNHDREVDRLKSHLANTEHEIRLKTNETLTAKDRSFNEVLQRSNQENANLIRDRERSYELGLNQMQESVKKEREAHETFVDRLTNNLNASYAKALEEQNKATSENAKAQLVSSQNEINALKNDLTKIKTADSADVVPPGVEQAIRRSLAQEYSAVQKENETRNTRRVNLMQDDYQDRFRDMADDKERLEVALTRENARTLHQNQQLFMDTINDQELQKTQTIRAKDQAQERELERTTKHFVRAQDGQRRSFGELFENLKATSEDTIREIRSDAAFELKMANRNYAMERDDMTRSFQKQLSEQRENYEQLLMDTRLESESKIKEQERRLRGELEAVNKQMEHRVKQMEMQQKERERVLQANHEEELDRLKKTNAKLIQSKG